MLSACADPDQELELEGIVTLPGRPSSATAEAVQLHLERTYCSTLGAETAHLPAAEQAFFASALESAPSPSAVVSPSSRRNSHQLLLESSTFDQYMSKKYATTQALLAGGSRGHDPCAARAARVGL